MAVPFMREDHVTAVAALAGIMAPCFVQALLWAAGRTALQVLTCIVVPIDDISVRMAAPIWADAGDLTYMACIPAAMAGSVPPGL